MSGSLDSVADILYQFALETHTKDGKTGKWHAAALLDGRRALCFGYNRAAQASSAPTCHAECDAILQRLRQKRGDQKKRANRDQKKRANQKQNLKNYAIFVIRIKPCDSSLGNSKPCFDCIQLMRQHGIKKVFYSNDAGQIVMERVNRMQNERSVGFQRMFDGTFQ